MEKTIVLVDDSWQNHIKLLKASNDTLTQRPKIKGIVKRIYKIKAKDMKCLDPKCNRKSVNAKGGNLRTCSGCCSKSFFSFLI